MAFFQRKRKPKSFYKQSGVIPMRIKDGELEILLITSRKRLRWVIPKGIVEPNMTPRESAEKEAFEEAGLEGIVSDISIGRYQYYKWGGVCDVEVFLMLAKRMYDDFPEFGLRNRQWLPFEEAAELIEEQDLRNLVKSLPLILDKKGQHGMPQE